ncbi:MAG: nucleoside phosphorylase [Bacteroidetes bacterium]|nr:nucleoside phosphorylase [Bacteroidota bacterium]
MIVGDQGRVKMVSDQFDFVEHKVQNREFVTHTGTYNGKRISVISTGIGTDNIDIFMNEVDALANIDLKTRTVKKKQSSFNIVRIGTSGALQKDIEVDSFVASEYGMGLDGLLHYYDAKKVDEEKISFSFAKHAKWDRKLSFPYTVKASEKLLGRIGEGMKKGITATAPGFFAPQGRELRLIPSVKNLERKLSSFRYKNDRIVNFEMETSALFGLSKLLGHNACTVCVIVGNRISRKFSEDYHPAMESLIKTVLRRLTS